MSLRFRICLGVWITIVALTALTSNVQAQEDSTQPALIPMPLGAIPQAEVVQISDADWFIEITPARKVITETTAPVTTSDSSVPDAAAVQQPCGHAVANAADYARIYGSIPFNRAEYNVNPSYRHDSTMEILTGNARHQTIVRHGDQVRSLPSAMSPTQQVFPYGYVRPALRLNYYRHFPSLNPYTNMFWNYGGI